MKWNNLKNGECPKCGCMLQDLQNVGAKCINGQCDFYISNAKLQQLIAPRQKSTEFQSEEERMSELNNYGREKRSEDFSDSPYP